MRRSGTALKFVCGALLALVAKVGLAEVITVNGTPLVDPAQMGQPNYPNMMTNTQVLSWQNLLTGPSLDLNFTAQRARFGHQYATHQNWAGMHMLTWVAQNFENRPISFVLGVGTNTNLNDFSGAFSCLFTLQPNSTERLAVVFYLPGTSQYNMKILPAPFDGQYRVVTNLNPPPAGLANVLHWRFSMQDALPARVKFHEVRRVTFNYNMNQLVDEFFQYKHDDWTGKIYSETDMQIARSSEDADLIANPPPADQFGSTTLPNQGTSDRWRITTYNGKKYFVHPNGKLFWSLGAIGVHDWMVTQVTGRTNMFEVPPSTTGPNSDLWLNVHNRQLNQQVDAYYVVRHNLRTKYGYDYEAPWVQRMRSRLGSWGFNTVGAWAQSDFQDDSRPYTYFLSTTGFHTHIVTPTIAWVAPPDPFTSDFQSWMTGRFAQDLAGRLNHTNLIGTFVDNEMSWGHTSGSIIDRHSIAIGTLASPTNQPAKLQFIRALTTKYRTIARLNSAWRRSYTSFNQLNQPILFTQSSQLTPAMQADMRDFEYRFASAYFTKVRAALTAAGFRGLYLGCRFWHTIPEVVKAAAQAVDVLSFNDYALPDQFNWSYYNNQPKPVLISEWSIPVNGGGTFGWYTLNRTERAAKVTQFMNTIADMSNIVGVQWFELYDSPVTNRGGDWENAGYGLLDITDTPRTTEINALRTFARNMYTIRQ